MLAMIQRLAATTIGVGAVVAAGLAFAYAVKDRPLEQKVAESDVVIIGRVVSIAQESVGGKPVAVAIVQVRKSLKGHPPPRLKMQLERRIVELDPQCCAVGHQYLLFLRRAVSHGDSTDIFLPVNARFGVYDLDSVRKQSGDR